MTLLIAMSLVVGGCTGDPAIPEWATATAVPADPIDPTQAAGTAASGAPAGLEVLDRALLGPDLRVVDVEVGGPVTVETRDGDLSWSLVVAGETAEALVGIRRVTDPQGRVRYAADLQGELVLESELHPIVLADAGAIGLYVAPATDELLPTGVWEVDVVGNDGPPAVRVGVRSGDPTAPQSLDVVVWATADVDDPAAVAAAWRAQMDATLHPHALSIGRLEIIPAGEAGAAFRTLGVDGLADDVHQACAAASVATSPPPRTAVVVLTERIGAGVLTAGGHEHASGMAVHRPDGDIDGFAVSTPGTPVLGPASHGCVAVAARLDPAERGLIALHEILHLAGITRHTTERRGRDFDLFPDTPECPADIFDTNRDLQVSRVECAAQDADNLMFWAAGGTHLTTDQTWRVRHHPLFRPSGG